MSPIDVAWVLIAASLVFLMQAGFCCLEMGLVRSKNSINVAIKNLCDFCVAVPAFWLVGFGLMFGASAAGALGTTRFAAPLDQAPFAVFFLFQLVFCGTSTTIVSGAVAERMRFGGYMWTSLLVSALIYPVFGHWAWNGADAGAAGGWLARLGFVDFAGSSVVHSVGAWVSLAAILRLGPRAGRFDGAFGCVGHSLPISTLGVMLLWFGWIGFNGGSTLRLDDRVPGIIANTMIGGASGALTALAVQWWRKGRPDALAAMNGTIAGLVAITASCHAISQAAALLIGAVGGIALLLGEYVLEEFRLDDAVGAIPVHGFAGVWGTLAVALFGDPAKLGTGLSFAGQLSAQALGAAACFAWAFGSAALGLALIDRLAKLRVDPEDERIGLNVSEHGVGTALVDLLAQMEQQRTSGEFTRPVEIEPHDEVGPIAAQYNRVLERVNQETERRESLTAELRASEERARRTIEAALDAFISIDDRGHVIGWNPSSEQIFGWSRAEVLGQPLAGLIVPDDQRAAFEAGLVRFARSGSSSMLGRLIELFALRRSGERFPIELSMAPVPVGDGRAVTACVRDISARKRMESELRSALDEAQAASRAKTQLLANASHELRTPLMAVLGGSELLRDPATPADERAEHLDAIERNGRQLLERIRDLLEVAELDDSGAGIAQEPCSPAALLREEVAAVEPAARAKGLRVELDASSPLPDRIETDPRRLRRALAALLDNAVRFTEAGSVRVAARCREARLEFSIEDTGPGISAGDRARLFQPFAQGDGSMRRRHGGLGLGLALAHRTAALLGGGIRVDTEPGRGSCFTLWIEAPAASDPPRSLRARPIAPQREGAGRVLVAEDSADSRRLVGAFLRRAGFQVEFAEDGQQALERALLALEREGPFDVILMDMQMPGMDGYTATRQLRAAEYSGPIVALTAHALAADRARCLLAGCDDFATKPIDRDSLIRLVRAHAKGESGPAAEGV